MTNENENNHKKNKFIHNIYNPRMPGRRDFSECDNNKSTPGYIDPATSKPAQSKEFTRR